MKIVFNSRLQEAPCTVFYHDALTLSDVINAYDYDHWEDYDLALFMTYIDDLEDLKKVKKKYPSLITAIIDPRGAWVKKYLQYADFLIVDSLEMFDYWAGSSLPIFEYAEYPNLRLQRRDHLKSKDKTIIGYHGNKIHLESMKNTIVPALKKLSNQYEIELWAMYNISSLGKWEKDLPDIKIRHIQWSIDNYYKYIGKVDIGIVPCFLPEQDWLAPLRDLPLMKRINCYKKNDDDYLLRFKMPTNPGRIIVWGLLNIPVVSDFFPSAMQCIQNGQRGLLAYSKGGWYSALEKLMTNEELRKKCADSLTDFVVRRHSFAIQNKKLLEFITLYFKKQ